MEERLAALRQRVAACRGCSLCETRQNTVFGVGNPRSPVVFIGEGPGAREDETGVPFVGRSGALLDLLLAAVDLSRERNVYIANIVKCRPPENRDPRPEEAEACLPYLREQLSLIRPKLIVCLGRIAALRFIDPDFKVTRQHGEFFQREDCTVMGTFHPSALLRNPAQKEPAFADMLKLSRWLKANAPEVFEL